MSGGGSGRGSGRAHFRSSAGCCICGTKSSSSRFTASQRYAEHFTLCFGSAAGGRSGDLCNACVLCVKRWLQRGKPSGLFSQVVDSKRGPGPKHMKEITKRARRREARAADSLSRVSTSGSTSSASHFASTPLSTSVGYVGPKRCAACWVDALEPTSQCNNNNNNSIRLEGATRTRAAAARQLEAANALANADTIDSYGTLNDEISNCSYSNTNRSSYGTRRCPNANTCSSKLNGYHYLDYCESSGDTSGHWSITDGLNSECSHEFRQPPPLPPPRIITRAAADSSFDWTRDASSTASSTPPSTPNRRQNRRTQLPPIRMRNSVEVDALLRQIMQSNSEAINFDKREIHMAVQRKLRLRSRTVNAIPEQGSTAASLSGCCSSSLGYASEFSSVENGCGDSIDGTSTTRTLRRS